MYEINFFGIDQYFVPSFQYGIITGLETEHHFDAKAGFALVMDRGTLGMNELSFLPAIKLGYRYQLPEEDFLFKAGVNAYKVKDFKTTHNTNRHFKVD